MVQMPYMLQETQVFVEFAILLCEQTEIHIDCFIQLRQKSLQANPVNGCRFVIPKTKDRYQSEFR